VETKKWIHKDKWKEKEKTETRRRKISVKIQLLNCNENAKETRKFQSLDVSKRTEFITFTLPFEGRNLENKLYQKIYEVHRWLQLFAINIIIRYTQHLLKHISQRIYAEVSTIFIELNLDVRIYRTVQRCIQKFPYGVGNEINNNKHSLGSNTKGYGGKTHKIAIQLHLVAGRCIICSSLSTRPVRKLLDTPSYRRELLHVNLQINMANKANKCACALFGNAPKKTIYILLRIKCVLVRTERKVFNAAFQKFPDWPPGARTANGTALCH
jgi:hypothetical protein